jgi:hypothetical protein
MPRSPAEAVGSKWILISHLIQSEPMDGSNTLDVLGQISMLTQHEPCNGIQVHCLKHKSPSFGQDTSTVVEKAACFPKAKVVEHVIATDLRSTRRWE